MSVDVQINELLKHVLLQYKAKMGGMNAYDPSAWEYPPDSNERNLWEPISAINGTPNDWLPTSRELYLLEHRRTLCRAFAQYALELKKQLGENDRAKIEGSKRNF